MTVTQKDVTVSRASDSLALPNVYADDDGGCRWMMRHNSDANQLSLL